VTGCDREKLASIIAAAAVGFFSISTVDTVFAAQKCTSIQARCAVEIGGRCDPETGRWAYKGRNKVAVFDGCVSRELKSAQSGNGLVSRRNVSNKVQRSSGSAPASSKAAADAAVAAVEIPSLLSCSAFSNSPTKYPAFKSKLTFTFSDASLSGERLTEKHPGKELYHGSISQSGAINIKARGEYYNIRMFWSYSFSGQLASSGETVVRGSMHNLVYDGKRDCSISFLTNSDELRIKLGIQKIEPPNVQSNLSRSTKIVSIPENTPQPSTNADLERKLADAEKAKDTEKAEKVEEAKRIAQKKLDDARDAAKQLKAAEQLKKEERARQQLEAQTAKLEKKLELEEKAKRDAEEHAAKRSKSARGQEDPLQVLDGVWVSISPPGPHIIFNRVATGSREVSLPTLGQASITVSSGQSGSNFQISGAGFTCYYLVLFTNNRRRMVWESKAGDSVCFASAVFERADNLG
jgi:hypothetical protein